MAKLPPYIPIEVTVTMKPPQVTLADLMAARDREERNLEARQRELRDARLQVTSLERQVSNVETSIDEFNERIDAISTTERVTFLESEVQRLQAELAEARLPRGRRIT